MQTAQAAQYQKPKNSIKKWVEDINRHFSKGDIQVDKKHIKRCSTSLIIREVHIKATKRYRLTLVRMPIIKKSTNNKCWRGCVEKGTLLHCWWESEPDLKETMHPNVHCSTVYHSQDMEAT